jgi:hypothetical protein
VDRIIIVRQHRWGVFTMKIWKIAALVALATLPLILLSSNNKQKKHAEPVAGDSDNIFESELSAD